MKSTRPFQVFPKETLLGQIDRNALSVLSESWTVTEYEKGQTIMGDEDTNSDICFLLAGSARVALFTESGREVSFLHLSKGDCFGEFSAIDGAPRSASIEAQSTCVAARLSSPKFRDVLREAPELSLALLESLVRKLRKLTSKVSDFNTLSADDRIRGELLELAQRHAEGRETFVVEQPPTQMEIAARVFSNRETVAREMGRMRNLGLLDRDGRSLRITSMRALRTYVESSGKRGQQVEDLELVSA